MAGRKRQRRSATEAPRGVPYGTDPAGKIQPGLFLCTERFKRRARARRRSNPPPAGCSPSDKLHHSTAGEAVLLYCEAARATLGPDEPNFYLEGLKFLCDRVAIDGVYIDDTALDHRSLQRARRILDTAPGRLVDIHSWNHNNSKAHFSNSLIVYMELLPYVDRLWLGEGFDSNTVSPDYWLIEMSGIPFGLNADMLQGGGNPWLGMIYGETAKLGWTGGDPRPMWKLWDDFGMAGSEMIGYWDTACPVHSDNPNVLVTVYRRSDRMLIAIGNFNEKSETFHLRWDQPGNEKLIAPAIEKMQEPATYAPDEEFKIAAKRGLLLVVPRK